MNEREMLCTFRLAGQWFGIEAAGVQEILRHQPVTALTWASDAVRGLLNLRGQIVTAVDLRRGLHLPPRDPRDRPTHVVVRVGPMAVSLWVDEVGEVLEVDRGTREDVPPTLPESMNEFIRGVYR
ncbi:MAG: chemotaxis protein CheW, partial [Candidatus Eiseniibacteriota bacterium]